MIVLLGFTYFSFMGALYNKYVNGELWKAGLFAGAVILIVSICVVIMCVSRATRWKEIGKAGQVVFAVIILITFGVSAVPFTGFLNAIEKRQLIVEEISNTRIMADEIDQSYNKYVDNRINTYDYWLRADSTRYENAAGSSDSVKIANLTTSLRNRLQPQSLAKCQSERRAWLDSVQGMSIWNIMLPKNLDMLNKAAKSWKEEYVTLSDISYDGNPPELFPYKVNDETPLKELGKLNTRWEAVLAALLSFFFMLLPYFVTRPFVGAKESNKNKKNKGQPDAIVDYE